MVPVSFLLALKTGASDLDTYYWAYDSLQFFCIPQNKPFDVFLIAGLPWVTLLIVIRQVELKMCNPS